MLPKPILSFNTVSLINDSANGPKTTANSKRDKHI